MSKRAAAGQVATGAAITVAGSPLPYLAPFLGAVANLLLSLVLSLTWGAYAEPSVWDIAWRSALLIVCSAALVWVTWAAGRARQHVLRTVSMAFTALSCMWTFVLTFNRWSFDLVVVYVITMGVAGMSLTAIRLLRGDGKDEASAGSPFGAVAERVQELKNVAALGKPKVIDGVVKTRVRMEPGEEFSQLSKAQGAVATLVPTKKGNIRFVPDRDNPGEGDMEITGRDYITNPPTWPGLSAPGESIAKPIRLAVYGNGQAVPIHLFGDRKAHRNAIGILVIAGQQGSGKTELVLGMAAEVISRPDAELTVIDPRKGEQLPAWLSRGATVISDVDAAEEFVAQLPAEVAKRAGILGRAGFKEWGEGAPIPAKVIIIDEAAKLIADRSEEDMVELSESVRSVGILIGLVMQRVTVDRMPSSVKKQRGAALCLGVADDKEAGRILSESTMEAGASPGSLGNREPGSLWIEAPGIPEEDWSRKARTYRPPSPADLEAAVAPYLSGDPLPEPYTPPRGGALVPDDAEGELAGDDDGPRDPDELDRRDNDRQAPRPPADPDLADVDPREEIRVPAGPRVQFTDDGPEYGKAELMNLLGNYIVGLFERGKTRIRQTDLGELVADVGPDNLKPPRLSNYLRELSQPGPMQLLRKEAGSVYWRIEPGEEVLERVRIPEPAGT
jgi:hypothetical protein